MDDSHALGRWWVQVVSLLLATAAALLMIAYVGYGEVWRTYPRIELDRLAAQDETVGNALDPLLKAGLPLGSVPGFVPLTNPLLASDSSIAAVYVTDPTGKIVQSNVRSGSAAYLTGSFGPSTLQETGSRFHVQESAAAYKVSLVLRSKIEPVGNLVIVTPKSVLSEEIDRVFVTRVVSGGVVLLALFGVAVSLILRRGQRDSRSALAIAYGTVFILMAAVVVSGLVSVYSDGVRDKTKALGNSLAQRLSTPLELGIPFDDFSQMDQVVAEYRKLYPELSYLQLTAGDRVVIDSDASRIGTTWRSQAGTYEYAVPLGSDAAGTPELMVRAGIPNSVILNQLWRSAKNFFVLFLASGFLAMLIFNVLHVLSARSRSHETPETRSRFQEGVIVPFLFLGIFVETMSNSFMPQHLQHLADAAGVSRSIVSSQFTVYYAALALALLPVGRLIESGRMKPVLMVAVVLELLSVVGMVWVTNIYAMFVVRAMAGAAHGIITTGAQSYLLLLASHGKVTRGSSQFLMTYQSGIIAGTAIGALLAVYMGQDGVFGVQAAAVLLVIVYGLRFLPTAVEMHADHKPAHASPAHPPLLPSLGKAMRDFGFVGAVLFVGIPAKIVNAGVIIFAMPLLLASQSVPQEDIGQIIMFYPIGMLLTSLIASRVVERLGNPRNALIVGTTAGALSVSTIGFLLATGTTAASSVFGAVLLAGGTLALGAAHGLINAPIVAYVAQSAAADKLGRSTVNSLYRFVERGGHMLGPILIGQFIVVGQQGSPAITWIGVPIVALGLLFWMQSSSRLRPAFKTA